MTRDTPMLLVITVVVMVGLLAAGRETGSQTNGKPDFTGNWELNITQSKFGKMPAPTRMTLQATRHGDVLHAVQTSYDQAGGPNAVEGDWFPDGKAHPLGSDGKMVSTTRWDGNTLVSERKASDNSYNETIRMTISSDGKTATEQIRLKSPNGDNNSTLIWNRR